MFRKIILGLVLAFGLSAQCQSKKAQPSFETKVKNYVMWFESLPDYKKREAARVLVLKLNSMSPYERGMWLAISDKYSKKKVTPVVKEIIVDSLTNEGVRKKLFADFAEYTSEKIDTIIILNGSIAKERTVASNTEIRKKIADWKPIIAESRRKLDSIRKIPEDVNDYAAYKAREKITHDLIERAQEGERELISLRKKIIIYGDESFDIVEKWNSYLIDEYEIEVRTLEPHQPTNEELDSGKSSGIKYDVIKTKYLATFDIGYKEGHRWDKYSRFHFKQINDN